VKLPFDCWEVALTTWNLHFQTGAAEQKTAFLEGGEPMIPSLRTHLDIFDIKALSVPELFAANTKQLKYKAQMAEFWNSFEQPLDAMLCAVNPSAGR
jgi:amidase